jgi:hypothetical protein
MTKALATFSRETGCVRKCVHNLTGSHPVRGSILSLPGFLLDSSCSLTSVFLPALLSPNQPAGAGAFRVGERMFFQSSLQFLRH